MMNTTLETSDLRLLLPEEIWLEEDDFIFAHEMSQLDGNESKKWQGYLNSLGMLGLERWLNANISHETIKRETDTLDTFPYLSLKGFKICLITQEEFIQGGIKLPKNLINDSELAAHFYVILEVLEEEETVLIRGFIRHDQLSQLSLQTLDNNHNWLPLSYLDGEPNHLLMACQYLSPVSIPLPQAIINQVQETVKQSITRLNKWLDGIIEEGWQTLDNLLTPEMSLAFATRSLSEGIKAGKLINLGMELGDETVALLFTLTPEIEEKIRLQVQLVPTNNQPYLPPHIKLSFKTASGKVLQEVESRQQDNYIQLKPFTGKAGKSFKIEVSFHDICIAETFEL